ncbi:hypothetical protein WJX79_008651 [Trebouxia sp. C0005]
MPDSDSGTDPSVFRAARTECHQARDEYFRCVTASDISLSVGPAVPLACKKQRQAFEACCKDPWVKHFDTLYFKQQQYAKIVKN